jgi:hypothetical protein
MLGLEAALQHQPRHETEVGTYADDSAVTNASCNLLHGLSLSIASD